jgi:hypothetical protein
VPTDLDGEITRIALSAVFERDASDNGLIEVDVISGGVEIYCGTKVFSYPRPSACVWLRFYVPEMLFNGHLRVNFFLHE